MCRSEIKILVHYLRTRMPGKIYLPCAAFLVIAGFAGGRDLKARWIVLAFMQAVTLLMQFRLLDDLNDIAYDRLRHPDRVMAQVLSLAPFQILLVLSFVINLILTKLQPGPENRLFVLLFLNAIFAAWYLWFHESLKKGTSGYRLVLGKYPAFVFLLSGDTSSSWQLLLSMSFVYLCFTVYEVLHDSELLLPTDADKALKIDIFSLGIVSFLMALELVDRVPQMGLFQGLIGLLNIIFVATYFGSRKMHFKSPAAARMVFVGGFAVLINFSCGVRI
jgi:hypothetical protein